MISKFSLNFLFLSTFLILLYHLLIYLIGNHPKAPQRVEELILPNNIETQADEEFVLFDSGSKKKNRIIMFGSETALNFLKKCETIFMDGTVSSGPLLFDQVYVIHGKYSLLDFNQPLRCLLNSYIQMYVNSILSDRNRVSKCSYERILVG